ncbi:MAG: flagellar motor switch protein FliM [Alphaproteobacteria bacterium]|nr:flagellar motor switch protein FliM [Candidatus Jidaibacter sp.]
MNTSPQNINDIDQNQVDDIFGDALASSSNDIVQTGINAILGQNSASAGRLPMLEIIFDRFVRIVSSSLRGFTSFTVDVEVLQTKVTKFGEYMDRLPIPSMISIFKAIELDNFGLVVVDSPLTYSLIDILFGGRKVDPLLKVEGRPYTSIEQGIIDNIVELFLNDLSTAFDHVMPITFQPERLESNPKFASIARPEDVIVILKLSVKMENRFGKIDLVLPFSMLEPIKKQLSKSFLGKQGSKDPIWVQHLESEVSNSKIVLDVVLNGITSNVRNIAALKVGDTIILDKTPEDELYLIVNNIRISSGKLGKVDDNVALMLSSDINVKNFQS